MNRIWYGLFIAIDIVCWNIISKLLYSWTKWTGFLDESFKGANPKDLIHLPTDIVSIYFDSEFS